MENLKTLTKLTEDEAKQGYKFIIQNRYRWTRTEIAEKLGMKEGSIWGMMQRLRQAGFDIPRFGRRSILKSQDFIEELRKLDEKVDKNLPE